MNTSQDDSTQSEKQSTSSDKQIDSINKEITRRRVKIVLTPEQEKELRGDLPPPEQQVQSTESNIMTRQESIESEQNKLQDVTTPLEQKTTAAKEKTTPPEQQYPISYEDLDEVEILALQNKPIESDMNRLVELTERLKKVDVNKKMAILEAKIQKMNDDLENQIKQKQQLIAAIEKRIYRWDLKYTQCVKVEDVQFAKLGRIYKEDYQVFQYEREQIGIQLRLEEEIEKYLEDAEKYKILLWKLKWQRPHFALLYKELMKHTGLFIKNEKIYVADTINLRIAELTDENKELLWEILASKRR